MPVDTNPRSLPRPSDGKAEKLPWLPQLLCGFLLCFMLFIFAPVEMVQLNSGDFWFTPGDFIGVFLLLFLAAFVAIELALTLLRRARRCYYYGALAFVFAVTFALYIQGNLLCQTNEVMTGGEPVWNTMLADAFLNLAIWFAILLAVLLLMLKSRKVFLRVVSCLSALLLVMTGGSLAVSLTAANAHDHQSDYWFYYTSRDDIFTVSGNGDAIVFMLDTLDTRLMDKALRQNPEILAAYDGFTYYRNTAGTYNKTHPSVVAMLTGEYCLNQAPFYAFSHSAFAESKFFPALLDNGYTINLYGTPNGILGVEQLEQVSNLHIEKGEVSSWPAFIKPMMRMVGYRYAPVMMQPILFDAIVERFNAVCAIPEGAPAKFEKFSNNDVRDLKRNGLTVDDSRRFFKYYCYPGAHLPYNLNRNGERVLRGGIDQYEQTLGYLHYVGEYIQSMKDNGVYDQSTIVVLADHGDMDIDDTRVSAPALLVKYPRATGEIRVSNAPTSLVDLPATVMAGVGVDTAPFGKPVHLWEEGEPRERFYYMYSWISPTVNMSFYLDDLTEYAVPDDATNLSAYRRTGNIYRKDTSGEADASP